MKIILTILFLTLSISNSFAMTCNESIDVFEATAKGLGEMQGILKVDSTKLKLFKEIALEMKEDGLVGVETSEGENLEVAIKRMEEEVKVLRNNTKLASKILIQAKKDMLDACNL
jgi:hypothetical protein